MTKASILKEVFENKEYSALCYKICNGNQSHKDLFQELYLILDSKAEEKIIGLYERKELKWFIIKILKTEWEVRKVGGGLSNFQKKNQRLGLDFCISDHPEIFADQESEEIDLIEVTETELSKELFIDKNDWYTNNLVNSYIKAGTMRKLSKETGIRTPSICHTVGSFKNKIKDKQNEYQIFMSTYNPKITLELADKRQIFIQAQKNNLSPEEYIEKLIKDKVNGKS